ncbi:MAG: guanylate kinase [Dehalococcoidia bacterium]
MAEGKKTAKEPSRQTSGTGPPLLIVLSGPSGVGKDTVVARLQSLEPRLRKVITYTTRPPRQGEVDGQDHFFVSPERFQQILKEGRLLEHAQVYDHWYGVPKDQVLKFLKQGYDVLLRTDIQGAATIKKLAPEGVFIFVAPASLEELSQRLRKRQSGPEDDYELRLATARREMDARGMFGHVVVNREGGLEEAVAAIQAILEKERQRQPPRQVEVLS